MSCQSVDLKGYVLAELSAAGRKSVEKHAAGCAACREELERLDVTRSSLLFLREEEIPRRIGFVSDKVFAESWWRRLWSSGPRLGFASAALLSVAIVAHGFAPRPAPPPPTPAVSEARMAARIDAEVARRLGPAVAKAVAENGSRQSQMTAQAVETALDAERRKFAFQRQADMLMVEENFSLLRKEMNRGLYLASSARGDAQ